MRPDRELLAQVAAHPEDDGPRLVCADWFHLHGASPRAELIQAQVALAGRLDPAQRFFLRKQVEALLLMHREEWTSELTRRGASDLRFSRGFIEEASLSEKDLAEHGAELASLEPVHRWRVEVRDGKGVAQAAAQPWFEQVRWLWLAGRGVEAAARALASAAHARHLEGLILSGVGGEGVSALARSAALSGLRSLSLTSNDELGDEGAEALAGGRLSLARLYLSGTGLTDEGAASLARAKPLQSLELLALNRNGLTDEGAEALAASKALVGLTRLELARNELGEEGALAFRSPKALPRLRRLDLSGMGLELEALEPLRKRLGSGLRG